ncbi:MAG: rhodoquinone biosynthesis methyltransferase RquA [Betaproteobacteria bacterium]|nr:rhodoquinone biosynthesis methyltransferase RquA [Betaproteobacteria bacterium]MDH5342950.1 rhodoquinone biosynthesis methyltransferase RquA [Betaproteobacteria bacterium]
MTKAATARRVEAAAITVTAPALKAPVAMPRYLEQTYWWAYVHPNAVRVFERQWLVNLILWGNYNRLRDAVIAEMNVPVTGRVLQVACVYGDFTEVLASQLGAPGMLDVADVAPVQIDNLKRKINGHPRVAVHHQDSGDLAFTDASYDTVVLFFLLHEMPEAVRASTVAEALRVVKPGGKVIFVDYHRPRRINPFRYVMMPILAWLEPFAMDLWRREIADWLPPGLRPARVDKHTYFGGLYQKVVITR